MLQRIYGTAWSNRKELKKHLDQIEEAKKRDHRKLGRELEIFIFEEEVGPGLPLWLPRGATIIEELERLAKETEEAAGYQRVRTPPSHKRGPLPAQRAPRLLQGQYVPADGDGKALPIT